MSKEAFETALSTLEEATRFPSSVHPSVFDAIRVHVDELETMVQGHKLAADAAMGLAGDLKAKLAEVEQESIRRGDLIADKAFKLVDVRKERDALQAKIEGSPKVWLAECNGTEYMHDVEPNGGSYRSKRQVHLVPVSDSKEGEKGE